MNSLSGSCSVEKVSGLIYINEDVYPQILEWKAVDLVKTFTIPFTSIKNLQATKNDSSKMILKVIYNDEKENEDQIKFVFTNRPTMNLIKDSLQIIISRHRTIIKNDHVKHENILIKEDNNERYDDKITHISDSSLLKNHKLQKQLLLSDDNLRLLFTKSVIASKLDPNLFWSTRLNKLRLFALSETQLKGSYNVLSTVKPIATSDNQVKINVSRDVIKLIFQTYPIVNKAFVDLVPQRCTEGEFWSRFFNSKLFRKLRGDTLTNFNERGDFFLDKYLNFNQNFFDNEKKDITNNNLNNELLTQEQELLKDNFNLMTNNSSMVEKKFNKFFDIQGNDQNVTEKLGNNPDVTMRFTNENTTKYNFNKKKKDNNNENQSYSLINNMNSISYKIINNFSNDTISDKSITALNSDTNKSYEMYKTEIKFNDLNTKKNCLYIKLNLDLNFENSKKHNLFSNDLNLSKKPKTDNFSSFLIENKFESIPLGFDLSDVYLNNTEEIQESYDNVLNTIKNSNKILKLILKNNLESNFFSSKKNLVPESIYQEIDDCYIVILELLMNFWTLLFKKNPESTLKYVYERLLNSKTTLDNVELKLINEIKSIDLISKNEKLHNKILSDFHFCVNPIKESIKEVTKTYKQREIG